MEKEGIQFPVRKNGESLHTKLQTSGYFSTDYLLRTGTFSFITSVPFLKRFYLFSERGWVGEREGEKH